MSWDKFISWVNSSPSYFLWGDVVAAYGEANQLHNNVLWAVVVGLIVSVLANLLTARLIAVRTGLKGKNSEQGSDAVTTSEE
jgi:hypothetical protein